MKTIAIKEIEKVGNDHSLRLGRSMEHAIMKKQVFLTLVTRSGLAIGAAPSSAGCPRAGHHPQGLCCAGRLSSRWNNRQLDPEHSRCVSHRPR